MSEGLRMARDYAIGFAGTWGLVLLVATVAELRWPDITTWAPFARGIVMYLALGIGFSFIFFGKALRS